MNCFEIRSLKSELKVHLKIGDQWKKFQGWLKMKRSHWKCNPLHIRHFSESPSGDANSFCICALLYIFMVNQHPSLEPKDLFKENIKWYFSKLVNTPEQILFALMLCFLALWDITSSEILPSVHWHSLGLWHANCSSLFLSFSTLPSWVG